ncbi:MAG: 16S rRNA (adenine(1518)-N(6)/adenine(1519)-N(6))-dimethyltransferase RsmA [Nevskiales bacterium]
MTQGHRARKRFGQNFLHDPAVIDKILRAINPRPDENLVEIGPGLGALTLPLLKACGHLQVVELDRDLIPRLQAQTQGLGELRVHQADALRFDFRNLQASSQQLRLIGNLPYNISTPLLFHLLGQADCIQDMHFMLQKEVVERMTAEPGSRTYGRLTVGMALQARCEPLFLVGPGAFRPAPKVESAVVRITPRADNQGYSPSVEAVTSKAFSARRKTLANALQGLLDRQAIIDCDIDPGLRPEQLSPQDFQRLGQTLATRATD